MVFVFLFLSLNPFHSFAQEIEYMEPIEPPFTMIGKGILNRYTGESIALICIGEKNPMTNVKSCNRVRHAYFGSNKLAEQRHGSTYFIYDDQHEYIAYEEQNYSAFFGPTYLTPDQNALNHVLKSIRSKYADDADRRAVNFAYISTILSYFTSAKSSTNAIQYKNGWNWAAHPKIMSRSDFKAYFESVNPEESLERFRAMLCSIRSDQHYSALHSSARSSSVLRY